MYYILTTLNLKQYWEKDIIDTVKEKDKSWMGKR